MNINVITIFPELFHPSLASGVVGKAISSGIISVIVHDLRTHTNDPRHTVDDSPYGGGYGMVMMAEPIFRAVESIPDHESSAVILLSPKGAQFRQTDAERLSTEQNVTLICGRYDGVDERVRSHLATEEISIGDYVLSGGELPALIVIDAIARLQPGVLGHGADAISDDTHTSGLLQHPQYTKPSQFRGLETPSILLSGDHKAIGLWRRQESLRRTFTERPDLLRLAELDERDVGYLNSIGWDQETV